jgi:hypothetical protein
VKCSWCHTKTSQSWFRGSSYNAHWKKASSYIVCEGCCLGLSDRGETTFVKIKEIIK